MNLMLLPHLLKLRRLIDSTPAGFFVSFDNELDELLLCPSFRQLLGAGAEEFHHVSLASRAIGA